MRAPVTTHDVFRLLSVRRVRLHPNGDIGAVVLKRAANEHAYDTVLYWLTGLGRSVDVARDDLDGVLDVAWSPRGNHFGALRQAGNGVTLGVGEWRGTASLQVPDASFVLPSEPDRMTWSLAGDALCMTGRDPSAASDDARQGYVHLRDTFPFQVEGRGIQPDGGPHLTLVTRSADGRWSVRRVPEMDDCRMAAISPDGRRIVYVRRVRGPARLRAEECLAVLDLATGRDHVLAQVGGPCWWPSWSPDGRSVVWLGHDSRRGVDEATDTALWVVPIDGAAPQEVCPGFGRSVEDTLLDDCTQAGGGPHPVIWDDAGRGVYALATSNGSTAVWYFRVPRSDPAGVARLVAGRCRVFRFDHARGQLVLAVASPTDPSLVEHYKDGGTCIVLAPNAAWLETRALSTPEPVAFAGAKGETVEGWLLPPVGRPLAGAPVVLQINRGRFGWTFYLESQILAGAGFAVGFINPHGAYGYGEEFRATPHHDPATLEVDDLLQAVDVFVARGVDANRIGINGASYGGFLVNWLASHTERRFAAAVSQASYCNRHNLWGTSSIGPTQWTSLGLPWERAEFLLSRSPISFVDKVRIPMLLIHGEQDTICPLEQAEQWYTALVVNGCQPELIIFRGEAHDLARNARPSTRVTRMTAITDWFRRHLQR